MKYSDYQNRIFEYVDGTERNIVISACAGSGKSTTLFKIAKILSHKQILFFAFNTHIEKYASKKLKTCNNVTVKTTHAYGLSCIKGSPKFRYSELKVTKVWECVSSFIKNKNARRAIYNAIDALRTFGCMEYTSKGILDFIDCNPAIADQITSLQFAITQIDDIGKILSLLDKDKKYYDFNDMLRFPILYSLMDYGYLPEVLLIDEVQDLSFYQFQFVKNFIENDVRIIGVGDENQAIYSFRGADGEAIQIIKGLSKAKHLPLSITYRCKSKIVSYVKRIYDRSDYEPPEFEAYDCGGIVKELYGSTSDMYCLKQLLSSNVEMIVSPKNKHIISIWFELLEKHNTSSSLKGSNITTMLKKLFNSLKGNTSFDGLFSQLQTMSSSDEDSALSDMAQAGLRFISLQKFKSYDQIFAKIASLDKDTTSKIHLHTVHSSKGLESDKVWLIDDFFASNQKINMQYVGLTRASDELYVIKVPTVRVKNGG